MKPFSALMLLLATTVSCLAISANAGTEDWLPSTAIGKISASKNMIRAVDMGGGITCYVLTGYNETSLSCVYVP